MSVTDSGTRSDLGRSESPLIRGGCLCGAIRYSARGSPYHITHCHCLDCRRASAAAFVTWASFQRRNFQFDKGEPGSIIWEGRTRTFCKECGTPLTFLTDDKAQEIDVTVCSFDQPELVTPQDHTWTEDRLPWVVLDHQLPEHARTRSDG
jgi:hypothetical protein